MVTEFLGTLSRLSFWLPEEQIDRVGPPVYQQASEPPVNEEYFEYIDVLETVSLARDSFTMIELGAGYGRWMMRAAAASRQCGSPKLHFIGVEADPEHFEWMGLHFQDNGLNPHEHRLVKAAVFDRDGEVTFSVGNSRQWYGQAILAEPVVGPYVGPYDAQRVPAVSLKTLLKGAGTVDLLDLDVQGSEYRVLYPAARQLDLQVKRVHIGTHNRTVEVGLRDLFTSLGWICRRDYPSMKSSPTPYGPVLFSDGVQTWLNPRWNHELS